MEKTQSMWSVTVAHSTSVFLASSLKDVKKKYITALNMPEAELIKNPGYQPGSFAHNNILGKFQSRFSPWIKTNKDGSIYKLEYTLENLDKLMSNDENDYGNLFDFREIPLDGMVLTSHLDG
jgi:hypothetical protein